MAEGTVQGTVYPCMNQCGRLGGVRLTGGWDGFDGLGRAGFGLSRFRQPVAVLTSQT